MSDALFLSYPVANYVIESAGVAVFMLYFYYFAYAGTIYLPAYAYGTTTSSLVGLLVKMYALSVCAFYSTLLCISSCFHFSTFNVDCLDCLAKHIALKVFPLEPLPFMTVVMIAGILCCGIPWVG